MLAHEGEVFQTLELVTSPAWRSMHRLPALDWRSYETAWPGRMLAVPDICCGWWPVTELSVRDVAAFYERKTDEILARYGPGPRIHYHSGYFERDEPPEATPDGIRRQLVASQARLLDYAARRWDAHVTLASEILDIGCGLGGGALMWAQDFGASVTAVTCNATHATLVRRFASQVGARDRVRAVVANAERLRRTESYDSAVAIESTCHMQRQPLFESIAALLRMGGRFFVADYLYDDSKYKALWMEHWYAPIGSSEEYFAAATAAGMSLSSIEDISSRTAHFWALTSALIEYEASDVDQAARSLYAHNFVRNGLMTGGLRYALMSFTRSS